MYFCHVMIFPWPADQGTHIGYGSCHIQLRDVFSLLLTTYSHHQSAMAPIRTKGNVVFAPLLLSLISTRTHSIQVSISSTGPAGSPLFPIMAATSHSLSVELYSGGHSSSATIGWVQLSCVARRAAVCWRFPLSAPWFPLEPAFSSCPGFPLPATRFPTSTIATPAIKRARLPILAPAFTT